MIVSLETAPRKYYPITNNPDFPNFYRMSAHAIVNNNHYSNSPFTHWANYALLSGLYPKIIPSIIKFGDFRADSLASVLVDHGYEATFIDSFAMNWNPGNEHQRLFQNLGFRHFAEFRNSTDDRRDRENKAFEHMQARLLEAEGRGKKALIFVDTMLGHHPWGQNENLSARENIYAIAKDFDRRFGLLLDFLGEHGLEDDILLMVTGDHGLRFQNELDSLQEKRKHTALSFNVPFMLYAPGLFTTQVRLPYVTSHVDITPTLLDLVGVDTKAMIHHGESVLNRRVDQRITFMMNTRLSPVDEFHWNGYFFTYNNLTGKAEIATNPDGSDARPLMEALRAYPEILPMLHDPRRVLKAATHLIDTTAAYQLASSNGASD